MFFIFLSSSFLCAHSQKLVGVGAASERYAGIKKQVYDTASLHIYYLKEHFSDTIEKKQVHRGDMVLQVSDKYLCFGNYSRLMGDSLLNFLAAHWKKAGFAEAEEELDRCITLETKTQFMVKVLTDLTKQQSIVHRNIVNQYEYQQPTPTFDWLLEDRDSVINGFPCRAARCHYGGRSYTAWYTDSIPLPYGPYLFGGLPGLIVQIYDKGNTWRFTCTSMEKPHSLREIYLSKDKKRRRLERKEALKVFRNEEEDVLNILIKKIRLTHNGKPVPQNNPRRPSNLIELE